MKPNLIILLMLSASMLLNYHPVEAQTCHETDSLLAKAHEKDQDVRLKLINLTRIHSENLNHAPAATIDSLLWLSELKQTIDKENQQLIASVLQNGLPEGLSPKSYETIWLIVDHADLKQQKHYLPLMQEAASKGLISANNYATLTDRIRMKEGKPQKYGTQSYTVTMDGKQVIYIWPVERPEMLNELRKEIGAGDIETYVQLLKTTTGCEVIYEPNLTVDKMESMGLLKNMNSNK